MKKQIYLLLVIMLVSGCVAKHRGLTSQESKIASAIIGQAYYTLANIWFPEFNTTSSHNIHTGAILSLGTKVKIERCSGAQIRFSDDRGITYTMVLSRKSQINLIEYFNRYFSKENIMGNGGNFWKLSEQEMKSIRNGDVDYGMTKEAVIMSYGYPPPSEGWTPSIQSNVWQYFDYDKLHGTRVYFENNIVVRLEGTRKSVHIPFAGRIERAIVKENNDSSILSEESSSNTGEILKYKDLLDSGAITKEEFDQKKKQLLGL